MAFAVPGAFQPDGQEDDNFFEQLASDLRDVDRLNLQQNGSGRDDAFSRLNMRRSDAPIVSQETSVTAVDDSWLEEALDEPSDLFESSKSPSLIVGNGPGAGSICDHVTEEDLSQKALQGTGSTAQVEESLQPGVLHSLGPSVAEPGVAEVKKQDVPCVPLPTSEALNNVSGEDPMLMADAADDSSKATIEQIANESKDFPHIDQSPLIKYQQTLTFVKELQWSSFGDVFAHNEPFSELVSDLDGGTRGVYSLEGLHEGNQFNTSIANFSDHGPHLLSSFGAEISADQANYGKDSWQQTTSTHPFWDEQGVHVSEPMAERQGNYNSADNEETTEQQVLYEESGNHDISGLSQHQVSAEYSGLDDSECQGVCQQSWENMYPGWFWDHATGEWKQVEGWHSCFGSALVEHGVASADSYSLDYYAGPATRETIGKNQLGGNMPDFGEGTVQKQADIQSALSESGSQPQVYWSEEYPGWYFDYQTNMWQQAESTDQASVPSTSLLEHSIGSQQEGSVGQAAQVDGKNVVQGGWTEHAALPDYQSGNQSVYLSGKSEVPVDCSTDPAISRNMSFSSMVQSSTYDSQQNTGSVSSGNSVDVFQVPRVDSWTGFSGYTSNPYPQPVTASGRFMDKSRSSPGRPLHPLAAFGFGGKLITMKAMEGLSGSIVVHDLDQLISKTVQNRQNQQQSSYFSTLSHLGLTGPLMGGGVTNKELFKWIDERVKNCEWEDPYCLSPEGLRLLWGVLKIACLHYGKLRSMGSSTGLKSQTDDGPEINLGKLFASAKNSNSLGITTSLDALLSSQTDCQSQSVAAEMKKKLMEGKRNEALQIAQQGQLWGPALVLALQIGEKVYAETVSQMAKQQFVLGSPLRTLFLLFSGQATELFTFQNLPVQAVDQNSHLLGSQRGTKAGAGGMLENWIENLSIIAANPTKGDEQVITHLGDSLWKEHGEVAGAHTCYLVAEVNFESFSNSARMCLIGADHFKYPRTFATPQAIQRTELYEYAKVQGNPQYMLIHFQPYKLLYAHILAEAGKTMEARRYCQLVLKTLKNAGRTPEVEACRQSASVLEDRLRLHSQDGYSFNAVPGKLVKNIFGSIDRSIHKLMGVPPPPQAFDNPQLADSVRETSFDRTSGNLNLGMKITSASNNSLVNAINQAEVPARSVSEPDLSKSPPHDSRNSVNTDAHSVPPKQSKNESSSGRYFGFFGSGILTKAVGFIKPHKKEAKLGDKNKFYYDEKLKRWVEEGAEQTVEEMPLAPPPVVANFATGFGSPDTATGAKTTNQDSELLTPSFSADMPPMPPSVNQFSARGRLRGVGSRYVDTFNKGGSLSDSKQTSLVPVASFGTSSTPAQLFMPSLSSTLTADSRDGTDSTEGKKEVLSADTNGHSQIENEPLLPKNLSSTFMATPPIPRRFSASNVTLDASKEVVQMAGPRTAAPAIANMSRAGSWSGESSTLGHQLFWPNKSVFEPGVSPTNVLASPPLIEPPMSYVGSDQNLLATSKAKMLVGIPNSVQGNIYGDMQEVEL